LQGQDGFKKGSSAGAEEPLDQSAGVVDVRVMSDMLQLVVVMR
jgi:hypothetical protein